MSDCGSPGREDGMNRWNVLVASLCLCLFVVASVAGSSPSAKEAPTGFTTPTLSENPGSQSVSNGFTGIAGETFGGDQAVFVRRGWCG